MNKLILSISIIASITFFSCDGKRAEEQKDNTDSVKVESTQAKTQAQEDKETYTSDDANLTSKAGEILAEATQDAKGKSESVKSSIKNVVKRCIFVHTTAGCRTC